MTVSPFVVKVGEQPLLEGVRVIHRQGGHEVERALGALADDAGDLLELGNHGIPAELVLLRTAAKYAGPTS